jgi:hypothetical protein
MNYEFCLNPLSLPADSREHAMQWFSGIVRGIAGLVSPDSGAVLYSDDHIDNTELSSNWTYADFRLALLRSEEHDLAGFLVELETRSPFLDYVQDEEFCCLINYEIRIFKMLLNTAEYDILKFACLHGAILISLPTRNLYRKTIIPITLNNTLSHEVNDVELLNVFDESINHIPQADWKNGLSDNIVFSAQFEEWYNLQTEKNKLHIATLISLADQMNFRGNKKQTKSIEGSAQSIWEWRGGCPDMGSGRIRFLYKADRKKVFILWGFIKTSPHDYTPAIRIAETALNELIGSLELLLLSNTAPAGGRGAAGPP